MKVLITGGAGFLGRRLAEELLQRGMLKHASANGQVSDRTIAQLVLVDVVPGTPFVDPRVRQVTGDVSDPEFLASVIDADTHSIFHLAAIVSGQAEADFDLGMRINVDASRRLLDICRELGHRPNVVFASSVAIYGGSLPPLVLDTTAVAPQSSYGMQKAVVELLVNDYTRKNFIDGRVLRLPTICVRPGRPNAAASSFASGIIREPLNGEPAVCPVSTDTRLWLLSPETVTDSLVFGHDVPSAELGVNRNINLPGLSLTVGDMVAALERVAGPEVVARIRWESDARVERIVSTWPGELDATRARALGFPMDRNFDDVIRQHMRYMASAPALH
ncbi:MAG: SDR family oxidoreductase [Burkholderiaceae bacterium]|nr:SDR family oxidoreductase [Burkholderiaceae bacterium]